MLYNCVNFKRASAKLPIMMHSRRIGRSMSGLAIVVLTTISVPSFEYRTRTHRFPGHFIVFFSFSFHLNPHQNIEHHKTSTPSQTHFPSQLLCKLQSQAPSLLLTESPFSQGNCILVAHLVSAHRQQDVVPSKVQHCQPPGKRLATCSSQYNSGTTTRRTDDSYCSCG